MKSNNTAWYNEWWSKNREMWDVEGDVDYNRPTEEVAFRSIMRQCDSAERLRYILRQNFHDEEYS